MAPTPALCVVLNNQHAGRIEDFVSRCAKDPAARVLFQPYTESRLNMVRSLDEDHLLPVPLFLVEGRFTSRATAAGTLRAVQLRQALTRDEIALAGPLRASADDSVYATNLLFASDVHRLAKPIPLSKFRKLEGGKPLLPGSWPAVVCLLPQTVVDVRPDTPDDLEVDLGGAVEGGLRLLFIRHRQRESRLRAAKVRDTLRRGRTLACEVPGCGFDYSLVYGALGDGYCHVHHLAPLGARTTASRTKLTDLAIVCANCHAMIHRGGECRSLDEVASARRTPN